MSLILDALKKADQERQNITTPPSIDSVHETVEAKPAKLPPWAPWLGLCLIGLIVLFTWLFFSKKTPLNTSEKAIQPSTTAISQESTKASSPHKTSLKIPATQTKTLPTVNIAKPLKEQKKVITKKDSRTKKEASIQDKMAIAELYKDKNTKTTVTETKNTHTKQDSFKNYAHIRLIKNLPLSVQSTIPTLIYSEHHYKENSSSIVINGKKLGIGQTIEGAIRIENILVDGVILKNNKNTFKMQALNSWLNYN